MKDVRGPGRTLFTRVLAVMLIVGLVPLGVSIVTTMVVIGDDKEADVVDAAITRADQMASQVDYAVRVGRTELHAAVLAANTGRFLDLQGMAADTVVAIRCMRGDTEVLGAAVEQNAHEILSGAELPDVGSVAVLDGRHAIVAERIGGVDAYALLDVSQVLEAPIGWQVGLSEAQADAEFGTVARRREGMGVSVTSRTNDGFAVHLTAPLGPAEAAALAVGRRAAIYSLLALIPLLLLAWVLSRAVTSPVRRLVTAINAAGGDETLRLPKLPNDEIGALGRAISQLSEALRSDASRLRAAVEFARHAAQKLDTKGVLESLGRSLGAVFPGRGYRVLRADQILHGELPEDMKPHAAALRRAVRDREDAGDADRAPVLCQDIRLADPSLRAASIGDATSWHAVVVGRPEGERDERGVDLLCETAGAALRNVELVRQAMVNEKLTVLGRLAAGVAHEINNPLAYVIVNLRTLAEELDSEHLETAEDALAGAERAARIVEDLSALHRGGARVRVAEADLRIIANTAVKIARARRPHVEISISANEQVSVVCERSRIEQALINLVINASDAVRHRPSPRVLLTVGISDGHAFVDVSDNGPGIPEETSAHIFDPFYTTKGEEGTGLGLFLAQSFVTSNRGELRIERTGPDGTTFRLALPVGRLDVSADARIPSSDPVLQKSGEMARILIVDDEPAIVRGMKRWLRKRASVTGVTNPIEGLELARNEEFALILCDLNMPNMNGREFLAALRDSDPEAADRVVIVTGSGGELPEDVLVLHKPVDSKAISRVLLNIGVPGFRSVAPSLPPVGRVNST